MHTFKKVGSNWCVHSLTGQTGQTVVVTKRNGGTSTVVLGEQVAPFTFALGTAPARAPETVGDLSRIVAMFDRARARLRAPAITLDGFRVNVAGQRARQPGSLTITSAAQGYDGRREWLGRVTLAGTFEAGRSAPADIAHKLRRFALDPEGEAAAYGALHGRCCFCNKRLGEGEDQRSVAVGYGPTCAENYGLDWGTRAARAANVAPVAPVQARALASRLPADAIPDEPYAGAM
jgi:hypothetical protein